MSDPVNDDDLIDALSERQFEIAFRRAEREFGDCVVDYHGEAFATEFATQLRSIAVKAKLEDLAARGFLVPVGVSDDGEISYQKGPNFPEDLE